MAATVAVSKRADSMLRKASAHPRGRIIVHVVTGRGGDGGRLWSGWGLLATARKLERAGMFEQYREPCEARGSQNGFGWHSTEYAFRITDAGREVLATK